MELTVGIAIVALVAVTAGSMFVAGVRSFEARHVGNMVMADLRFAMDIMASDLRAATWLDIESLTEIDFTIPGSTASTSEPRTFLLLNGVVSLETGPQQTRTSSPIAENVASLLFELGNSGRSIRITATSVSAVDGVTGSGLPLTMTTIIIRRNFP